ncbi:MAG: N-formylglutamate amidohydrolase [Geminicoccaceae bacterium]
MRTPTDLPSPAAPTRTPPFVEYRPTAAPNPVLLLCDHADKRLPPDYGTLGLAAHQLELHIAYDPGAAALTRRLAELLRAPALFCHASRLFIDVNRDPRSHAAILASSDGIQVPGNRKISQEERRYRVKTAWKPYHRAIARHIATCKQAGIAPAIISLHTFTAVMNGHQRPWHAGVLWDRDGRLALPVLEALQREQGLCVGDNQPYSGRDAFGYTVPFHAERRGLPSLTFEIRQDLLRSVPAVDDWAHRLYVTLKPALARLDTQYEARGAGVAAE